MLVCESETIRVINNFPLLFGMGESRRLRQEEEKEIRAGLPTRDSPVYRPAIPTRDSPVYRPAISKVTGPRFVSDLRFHLPPQVSC